MLKEKNAVAAPQVTRLNHVAFRCRDAEETRKFYEDVLGFPLVVAEVMPSGNLLAEAFAQEKGETLSEGNLMTLFFKIGDAEFITFFDLPHTVREDRFCMRDGVEEYHLAFEVGTWAELLQFKTRLAQLNIPVYGPVDHQANHSIYFFDPNGLSLEITIRDKAHDVMLDFVQTRAHENLEQWTIETTAIKASRLAGSESARRAIDDGARRMADRVNAAQPEYVPAGEQEAV